MIQKSNINRPELFELEKTRVKLSEKNKTLLPVAIMIPLAVLAISFIFLGVGPGSFILAALGAAAGFGIYFEGVMYPFKQIKNKVRRILLREFMSIYHPEITFDYFPEKQDVKSIIKSSKLISPNIYEEEDVIKGKYKDLDFYLSEIHLKKRADKSTYTIFKGMLFKIRIPGKNFPKSQIQSKPGLIKLLFNVLQKNKEFGFHYDTNDARKFEEELGFLFPFIRHLHHKQGDIRIKTEGNEITLLIESKMKFLDDPKPNVDQTFLNEKYFENIGKQMNSLLFIMESLVNEMDKTDIEERLELKTIEYMKRENLLNDI